MVFGGTDFVTNLDPSKKHKVPPAYSRAEDGARSPTAAAMTNLKRALILNRLNRGRPKLARPPEALDQDMNELVRV